MVKAPGKNAGYLIFLCWAAYTAAYVARLNYNASMVELLAQLGTTREAAGTVSSCFFFAYGVGQLVNGLLSRRYNTRVSVALALAASCLINLAMTQCRQIGTMKYLWFCNGAFQSVLWSSLIKTLSDHLEEGDLSRAVMAMSTTVASGTFAAYGLAALFSALKMPWTAIFYVASAAVGLVAVVWFVGMGSFREKGSTASPAERRSGSPGKLTPVLALHVGVILVCAVANGFVKDGVITWVPSILKETFGVPASLSIIVTLLLPVLSIFGASLVERLHRRLRDENALNGIFYFATVVLVAAVTFTLKFRSVALTLVLFGGIACLMAAVNNVITSVVPLYSRDRIDSGLAAGLLNTFCYVGSTMSTSFLGRIADNRGWTPVFGCILLFTLAALAACALSLAAGKKAK